jgi:uncharacterized FAD-dependent dehydrogenase
MGKIRILFIGAGVGNLTAANFLLDNSIDDFLILEKGEILQNRICPGVENLNCSFCNNGCATIEGVGGANALNGNKLCYFPASNGVIDFASDNKIHNAFSFLEKISSHFIDPALNTKKIKFEILKNYNSDIFNKSDFSDIINNFTNSLKNHIISNCEVVSIKNINGKVRIITNKGEEYLVEKLVIGTGRSSYKFLKDYFDTNNLRYSLQTQDIGIRIETNKENFSEKYYYQVDPKFKFTYNKLGSCRTFCAHNQGKVVPVRFGDSFFADGAFGKSFGEYNNIALMTRSNSPLNLKQIEDWCKKINTFTNNRLELGDVIISKNSNIMTNEILKLIPCFPSETHKQLLKNLLNDLFSSQYNILRYNSFKQGKLKIYGPAIDRYWTKPNLNKNFSIAGNENIFVIGDAAGLSRGFIQAMFSGYTWANSFLGDEININKKEDFVWLNLV